MPESFERKVKLNENRKEYLSEAQVERKTMPELSKPANDYFASQMGVEVTSKSDDVKVNIELGKLFSSLNKQEKITVLQTVLDSFDLSERADIIQAELGRLFHKYDKLHYDY